MFDDILNQIPDATLRDKLKKQLGNPAKQGTDAYNLVKYGSFTRQVLAPWLMQKQQTKLFTNLVKFDFFKDNKETDDTNDKKGSKKKNNNPTATRAHDKELKRIFDEDIYETLDLQSNFFRNEGKLFRDGNGVIVHDWSETDKQFLVYNPIYDICQVNTITGKVDYLVMGWYYKGGDLVAIKQETRVIGQPDKVEYFTTPASNFANGMVIDQSKKTTTTKEAFEKETKTKQIEPSKEVRKEINATYFQNIDTDDFRGLKSIDFADPLSLIIDKIWGRINWETDFNRSKLTIRNEQGMNAFVSQNQNYNEMWESGHIMLDNSFYAPMGDAGQRFQYLAAETGAVNAYLGALSFFLAMKLESIGFQRAEASGDSQKIDLALKEQKEAETRMLTFKKQRREFGIKKMIQNMFKQLGKNVKLSQIMVKIDMFEINTQNTIVDNILKLKHGDIIDASQAMQLLFNYSKEEADLMAKYVLDKNNEDRKKRLEEQPVEIYKPSIQNPNPEKTQNKQSVEVKSKADKETKGDDK